VDHKPVAVANIEQHHTVDTIAGILALSRDSVIRLFEREPGTVIVQTPKGNRGRRGYRTLRVPESVLRRVIRRMTIAAQVI
jgi:transcriptional regulator GlxA family with amidase domain